MILLNLEELLHVAVRTLGAEPDVRDMGLLVSALARPQAAAFGGAAYPTIHNIGAALLHSLAPNHALVDGNERLALAVTIASVLEANTGALTPGDWIFGRRLRGRQSATDVSDPPRPAACG